MARDMDADARRKARARAAWSRARAAARSPRGRDVGVAVVSAVLLAGIIYVTINPVDLLGGRNGDPPAEPPIAGSPDPDQDQDSVTLNQRSYDRGACYTWIQDTDSTTAGKVDCAEPHLFEAVDKTNISDDFPAVSEYPDDGAWRSIAVRYCGPIAEQYLGYPIDPYGRFAAGSLHPVQEGWTTGDRELTCGLIVRGEGEQPGWMKPFVGAVPGANQAFLFATGVCLVTTDDETDTETGGEVPCGAPHHGFATGAGTMPETSNGEPPSDDAFAAFAKPHCEGVATQFLGRPYQDDPTMTVSWYPILAESWRAGTRQFTCAVMFRDAAGNLLTVTGEPASGVAT